MRQTDDRFAVSRIYEESWKWAYKDIVPQTYLESIPAGQWCASLDKNKEMHTLLAVLDGTFIGTSSYGRSRFLEFEGWGEIVSIYFLPEYAGKGYGRQLLGAALDEMAHLGFRDVFLWVLEDNARARKFYEKAGFIFHNNYLDDDIGGKKVREIQYCYHISSC